MFPLTGVITVPVFMRESNYYFQHVLVIAILSVHLSHGWISQKLCKIGSPNLHCRLPGKLFHKFKGGHPERGC